MWPIGAIVVAFAVGLVVTRLAMAPLPSGPAAASPAIAEPSASYPPPMDVGDLYAAFTSPGRAFVGGRAGALDVVSAGEIVLPSGRIVAADAFLLSTEPFTTTVAAGRYPVSLLSATVDEGVGSDVAAAMLRLAPGEPVSWDMALVAGQDITRLEPGSIFGYGVDFGDGLLHEPRGRRAGGRGARVRRL